MNARQNTLIFQEEINGTLWLACDTFSYTVDPSKYKYYILIMLFEKYISMCGWTITIETQPTAKRAFGKGLLQTHAPPPLSLR
jgi:hypothetical protein